MHHSPLTAFVSTTLSVTLALGTGLVSLEVRAAPEGEAEAAPATEVSQAEKTRGENLSEQAIEAFGAKDYDRAVELFKQAYEADPQPNYLFNIGRVYEEAGDLENAVEYYGNFVKQPGVDLDSRGVALDRLKVLRAILEETAEPKPKDEEPKDEEPKDEVAPPPDPGPDPAVEEEKRKAKVLSGAGFALVGVGAAALIGGAVTGVLAQGDNNSASEAASIEDRRDLLSTSQTKALTADVLYGVGGALAVTGVVLVVVGMTKKSKAEGKVAVTPTFGPRGAGIDLRMRF